MHAQVLFPGMMQVLLLLLLGSSNDCWQQWCGKVQKLRRVLHAGGEALGAAAAAGDAGDAR